MARYKSPPTCGYCCDQGHTQRNCPTMKHDAASGDRWAKTRVEEYKHSAKNRQCSYCKEQGHNKRGCVTRKQHRIIYEITIDAFRAEMLVESKKVGISVGSLMKVKPRRAASSVVSFVEKVNIKDKGPDYKWVRAYYVVDNENPKPTLNQMDAFRSYGKYYNSLRVHISQPTVRVKSLTGTGLGYWGDEDHMDCGLIEVLESINKAQESYEVVSAA